MEKTLYPRADIYSHDAKSYWSRDQFPPSGLPSILLPRGVEGVGLKYYLGANSLKLDWGELAHAPLASAALVSPFDPVDDCQA